MRRLKGRSWINSSVHKSTLGQNKLIHCIWRVNYLCRRYPKAEMARPCTSFDRIIIIVLSDAKGREDVDSWGHTKKDHNINIKKNNKIAILLWIFSSNQLTSTSLCLLKSAFFTFLFWSAIEWQQLINKMFFVDDKLCFQRVILYSTPWLLKTTHYKQSSCKI